jgi:AbrB family looped-hinge helix DNA binding protein
MDIKSESCHTAQYRVRVAAGGRIVIPADVRQDLGLQEGEELLLFRDGDGIRITTYRDAIRRAQELFARIKKPGESVVDELISERRVEAEREEREFRDRSKGE